MASSSSFSFDNFDAALADIVSGVTTGTPTLSSSGVGLSVATTPDVLTSATSTPSGESNPFTVLGSALTSGGGANGLGGISGHKRLSLLFAPTDQVWCMGAIQGTKFCTRKPGTCTVAAHGLKKFQGTAHSGYLRESEISAFCQPAFDLSKLSKLQLKRLQEVQLTLP